MTGEGDGSSNEEENEILCKVLKHKKEIVNSKLTNIKPSIVALPTAQ